MENQVSFLRHLCRTAQNGGRVIVLPGTHVCEIYDVAEWTWPMQRSLEQHFPCAQTAVEACTHSLSGFMVRVRFDDNEAAIIMTTSALIAVMAAVTAYCLGLIY